MTTQPFTETGIPQWTLGDRMRKSLHHADVSVQEMADYLGVTRSSVGNWINDHIEPRMQTLRLWSLRTGVPLEWIRTGVEPAEGPDGAGKTLWSRLATVHPIRPSLSTDARMRMPLGATG